jgi:hypothetical protein
VQPSSQPSRPSSQPSSQPLLEDCALFAVFGSSTVTFDGITTTISKGLVGLSPGTSITGSYVVNDGPIQINTANANSCAARRVIAYQTASSAKCDFLMGSGDLSGLVLISGVYCANTFSTVASSVVTLNAQNNPAAQWVFVAGTTVVTGASSSIVLVNGGNAENVFWALGTSATLGASSTFAGSIIASAAITFGSASTMIGHAYAGTAVTFASGSTVTIPINTTPIPSYTPTTSPLSFMPSVSSIIMNSFVVIQVRS